VVSLGGVEKRPKYRGVAMTYLVDVRPIVERVQYLQKSPCRDGFCGFTMPISKTFSGYSKAKAYAMRSIEHANDHHWETSEEQLSDSTLWCIEEPNGDLYEIELGEMQSESTGGL
jgi:hypothetical protein